MGLRIVILGAPGAGKGTQAMRIAASYGVPHVSTGDIFREQMQKGTELAREIRPYMESGRLVPDELTCAVVAERLARPDCANGYVLDGFPRTLPQAEALDAMLRDRGQRLDVAIELEVPDDEIVERLSARRTCSKCGAIFNLKFNPPRNGDTRCDRDGCGGALTQRADDREETVRQRLKVYYESTRPLLAYYRGQGLLRTLAGDGLSPDALFEKVEEILCAVGAVETP